MNFYNYNLHFGQVESVQHGQNILVFFVGLEQKYAYQATREKKAGSGKGS